jgi:hypothetical protein
MNFMIALPFRRFVARFHRAGAREPARPLCNIGNR